MSWKKHCNCKSVIKTHCCIVCKLLVCCMLFLLNVNFLSFTQILHKTGSSKQLTLLPCSMTPQTFMFDNRIYLVVVLEDIIITAQSILYSVSQRHDSHVETPSTAECCSGAVEATVCVCSGCRLSKLFTGLACGPLLSVNQVIWTCSSKSHIIN